jgi:hypothetical protein
MLPIYDTDSKENRRPRLLYEKNTQFNGFRVFDTRTFTPLCDINANLCFYLNRSFGYDEKTKPDINFGDTTIESDSVTFYNNLKIFIENKISNSTSEEEKKELQKKLVVAIEVGDCQNGLHVADETLSFNSFSQLLQGKINVCDFNSLVKCIKIWESGF